MGNEQAVCSFTKEKTGHVAGEGLLVVAAEVLAVS